MTHLLVGFDSAWTPGNAGALIAVLRRPDGSYLELGDPQLVSFPMAAERIADWQATFNPTSTLVLLDQPTIVPNATGQRPVENIVGAPVSLRYGGVQPASRSRREMFGDEAPLWPFLAQFGGAADPLKLGTGTLVIETYPVLALAALGWMRDDTQRATGRLPKYNPQRRASFSHDDWRFVAERLAAAFSERGLREASAWALRAAGLSAPRKADQDALDACLCLLVSLHLAEGNDCLMVGDLASGYMVVPYGAGLHAELETRCLRTARGPEAWVRAFRLRGHEAGGGDSAPLRGDARSIHTV